MTISHESKRNFWVLFIWANICFLFLLALALNLEMFSPEFLGLLGISWVLFYWVMLVLFSLIGGLEQKDWINDIPGMKTLHKAFRKTI